LADFYRTGNRPLLLASAGGILGRTARRAPGARTGHEERTEARLAVGSFSVAGTAPAPRLVWLRTAEMVLAGFAILFMTGGLTRLLSGGLPEEVARTTSSPLVQIAGVLVYIQTVGFLALRMQRYLPLLSRNMILFLPVALAIASTYWSSDPELTWRRSLSLLGTTLLGVYLGLRFRFEEVANLLFVSLALIVGASFAVAVVFPEFGVHQAGDALTGHHAGLWRGLYWHKIPLGAAAGILVTTTVATWSAIAFPSTVKLAVVLVAATVVMMSGSAQSLVLMIVFATLIVAHYQVGAMKPALRAAAFFWLLFVASLTLLFFDEAQAILLDWLDRDPTLSSRIYIWRAALAGGLEHAVFGNGYNVGWFGGSNLIAFQRYRIDVGHAHNGYIQIWLDLGLVGLGSLLMVILIYWYRALLVSRASYPLYILSLYFLLKYMAENYVASTFMKYQDIDWMMFCLLFVMCSRALHNEEQGRRVLLGMRTEAGR
jgi:O-antigen ligase